MNNKKIEEQRCPHYKKCSGCQIQNMSNEDQLKFKQSMVKKSLREFGKVNRIIGMKNPYHYRNKAQAKFITARNGKIVSGIYQSARDGIVSTNSCLIEDEQSDAIIVTIRNLMKSFKLTTYNPKTGKGFLRHVLVRKGFTTGEIMVVLVTNSPVFPGKTNFIKTLMKRHPEITTIVQNVSKSEKALMLGDTEHVLYGNGYITDILWGCKFRISSRSFYQINPTQTEVLYNKALKMANLKNTDSVIDAYCGIGTIGIIASKNVKKVYGVEVNARAVKDAVENARLNNSYNIYFRCEDAGNFMDNLSKKHEQIDVVFTDPPRAGLSRRFINSLIHINPERIVYISCNYQTLARDLRSFAKYYTIKEIQPVDMFPHTKHVECVVLMTSCNQKG